MLLSIPVFILSMVLFFVLFFGIGFLLNMILRGTWVMAFIYPIVYFFIIDTKGIYEYVRKPSESFSTLSFQLTALEVSDVGILAAGMCGAIGAGICMKLLRLNGYRMF